MQLSQLVFSLRGRISRLQFGLGLLFLLGIVLCVHGLGSLIGLLWLPMFNHLWLDAAVVTLIVFVLYVLCVKYLRNVD